MTTKHTTVTTTHTRTRSQRQSEVTLHNCQCHTYMEVIRLLKKAIKCDETTAIRYALTAEEFGSVVVYKGTKEDCEKVASILGSTGLKVSVVG